jgi:hypothetical protein
MTRLLVATLLLLLGACPSRAAEKPVLALINGSSDPAAAELLLAKLSAGGEFVFVERARQADAVDAGGVAAEEIPSLPTTAA